MRLSPSPGEQVFLLDSELLSEFLGLDLSSGVHLGTIRYQDIPADLNLGQLIQKHVSVLAISGAGKSYFVTVLVEELLRRDLSHGRPAVVIFDVHGEYPGLANKSVPENAAYAANARVVDGSFVQIATPSLSPPSFAIYQPHFSPLK